MCAIYSCNQRFFILSYGLRTNKLVGCRASQPVAPKGLSIVPMGSRHKNRPYPPTTTPIVRTIRKTIWHPLVCPQLLAKPMGGAEEAQELISSKAYTWMRRRKRHGQEEEERGGDRLAGLPAGPGRPPGRATPRRSRPPGRPRPVSRPVTHLSRPAPRPVPYLSQPASRPVPHLSCLVLY